LKGDLIAANVRKNAQHANTQRCSGLQWLGDIH